MSETLLARVRVVLCRPSHPGNIGASARAMKTMGLDQLWLVSPAEFPSPEAQARASGATDLLAGARVCDTLGEALSGCVLATAMSSRRRELMPPVRWPREAAAELVATAQVGEVAIVFGPERTGLDNEDLLLCQRLAMIPANPQYASLNLAAAVQVMAYELRLAVQSPGEPPQTLSDPAPVEDVERFHAHLETVLVRKGFLDPQAPRRLMPRLRRLFARTGLEREEVNILRGILDALGK